MHTFCLKNKLTHVHLEEEDALSPLGLCVIACCSSAAVGSAGALLWAASPGCCRGRGAAGMHGMIVLTEE